MKTLAAATETMLATRSLKIARCMWVQLRNMQEMAFTDIDVNVFADIGLSSGGGSEFMADVGILPSNIELAIGMEPDNMEFSGPISDIIPRAQILGGLFNGARIRVFDIDWSDQPNPNIIALLGGRIADAKVREDQFTFEVRSHTARYNQIRGRVLSPYCTHDFGDENCGVVRPEESATVISATSALELSVNIPVARPDDFYNLGTIDFATGENAGLVELEIFDFTGSTATVELLAPLPAVPGVGDQLIIRQGCSKIKYFPSDPTLRTCVFWANARRFGGFDRVPGNDNYFKTPLVGQAGV